MFYVRKDMYDVCDTWGSFAFLYKYSVLPSPTVVACWHVRCLRSHALAFMFSLFFLFFFHNYFREPAFE